MNLCFEWIFWILKRWIIYLNIHSASSLTSSKQTKTKCLKLISNHSRDHYWNLFQSISEVLDPQEGSEVIFRPFFGILNNFAQFFLKWLILLNILDSIEWIFSWMNIRDFVLNWILNWILNWTIFRPNSMKKWIFKTYQPGLVQCAPRQGKQI